MAGIVLTVDFLNLGTAALSLGLGIHWHEKVRQLNEQLKGLESKLNGVGISMEFVQDLFEPIARDVWKLQIIFEQLDILFKKDLENAHLDLKRSASEILKVVPKVPRRSAQGSDTDIVPRWAVNTLYAFQAVVLFGFSVAWGIRYKNYRNARLAVAVEAGNGDVEPGVLDLFEGQSNKDEMPIESNESNESKMSKENNEGKQPTEHNEGKLMEHNEGKQPTEHNEGKQPTEHNEGKQSTEHNEGKQSTEHNEGKQSTEHNEGKQSTEHNEGKQSMEHNEGKQSMEHNEGKQSMEHNKGRSIELMDHKQVNGAQTGQAADGAQRGQAADGALGHEPSSARGVSEGGSARNFIISDAELAPVAEIGNPHAPPVAEIGNPHAPPVAEIGNPHAPPVAEIGNPHAPPEAPGMWKELGSLPALEKVSFGISIVSIAMNVLVTYLTYKQTAATEAKLNEDIDKLKAELKKADEMIAEFSKSGLNFFDCLEKTLATANIFITSTKVEAKFANGLAKVKLPDDELRTILDALNIPPISENVKNTMSSLKTSVGEVAAITNLDDRVKKLNEINKFVKGATTFKEEFRSSWKAMSEGLSKACDVCNAQKVSLEAADSGLVAIRQVQALTKQNVPIETLKIVIGANLHKSASDITNEEIVRMIAMWTEIEHYEGHDALIKEIRDSCPFEDKQVFMKRTQDLELNKIKIGMSTYKQLNEVLFAEVAKVPVAEEGVNIAIEELRTEVKRDDQVVPIAQRKALHLPEVRKTLEARCAKKTFSDDEIFAILALFTEVGGLCLDDEFFAVRDIQQLRTTYYDSDLAALTTIVEKLFKAPAGL